MECVISNVPIVFVLCILLNAFQNHCMEACWLSPLLCVVITATATLPLTTHQQWVEPYTFTSFIVMCSIINKTGEVLDEVGREAGMN